MIRKNKNFLYRNESILNFDRTSAMIICMREKEMIPGRVLRDIVRFAKKADLEKVVLFGSRARRTNNEKSDIDLAVYGGDFDQFYWDIQEQTWSLLMFDLVDMNERVSDDLLKEIERDGRIIYEKD